tara:strand:+ start:777 stop:1088 length:312 start_codon:yes stop_codon:yes gene_type:complete
MGKETTASLAISLHIKSLNLKDKWNEKRIKRLCGFLRISEAELSALIGIPLETFTNQLARRNIYLPGCILLTLMEDFFIGDFVSDTIPNLLSGALKNGQPRDT